MNIDSLKEYINDIAPPKSKREQKTVPKVEIKVEEEREEDTTAEDTTPIPDIPPKGKLVPL